MIARGPQAASLLSDFRLLGTRFVVKAVQTSTKRHGPHVRLEHRLNGRIVDASAWLDAFRAADPDGYRAWLGADDEEVCW